MGRKKAKVKAKVFVEKHAGTKKNMVVVSFDDFVVAEDEDGKYLTKSYFVDSGLLDPHRDKSRSRVDLSDEAFNQLTSFTDSEKRSIWASSILN